MRNVRPKKSLGQHFLKDKYIAERIAQTIQATDVKTVLEVGPGMGVLTEFLLKNRNYSTYVIEIDHESVDYLYQNYVELHGKIIEEDFLKLDIATRFPDKVAIIGNFPYHISSQILFHALQYRDFVPELAGMFQKEVAMRIAAKAGSKTYGILSVLTQAFYHVEYLFTVDEHVFHPPPKVKSGVIRMVRNEVMQLDCDEKLFVQIVKTTFNQRRKMISNSLKPIIGDVKLENHYMDRRPEQLTHKDFEILTQMVASKLEQSK